jgi:hypothetical protein
LGVAGRDVAGQDVECQGTCCPVGTDRGLGRRRRVVGDVWDGVGREAECRTRRVAGEWLGRIGRDGCRSKS